MLVVGSKSRDNAGMIIDFHTHSHASDGALSPAALLQRAIEAGITQFALTDHDTVAGYRQLRELAIPAAMQLVAGVELSCQWAGSTIHVVGLGVDVENPGFAAGLARLDAGRRERAGIIAAKLEKIDMPGALAGALDQAGDSQVGRPHFAAWMIAQGHVPDANTAFSKHLGAGKLGDVKACWPQLAEVTGWICEAGGTAVLAHPLKYRFTRAKLKRLLADFTAAGGRAMEVFSGRQMPEQTADLCRLVRELDLLASVGSDFHRDFDYGPGLGVDTLQLPGGVELWQPGVAA